MPERVGQQIIEAALGGVGDGPLEGIAERRAGGRPGSLGQDLVGGLGQQRVAGVIVEDLEAGRHAGLQGEALQQPLAEGVDGLHLEAARRLDHQREQLARAFHLLRRRERGRAAPAGPRQAPRRRPSPSLPAGANTRVAISAAAALV